MEFINFLLTFAGGAVCYKGGTLALNGLTIWGEGRSNGQGARQEEGMEKIVGGVFVILVGIFVVPQLGDWLISLF